MQTLFRSPFNRNLLIGYAAVSAVTVLLGFLLTPVQESSADEVRLLVLDDVMYIFGHNLLYMSLMLLLSLFVLSPVLMVKFLLNLGGGANMDGVDPLFYYASSFLHGFGEWAGCFLILLFTAHHVRQLVLFFRKEITSADLYAFYFRAVKRIYPPLVLILLVSAIVEVYVSNRLIVFLLQS